MTDSLSSLPLIDTLITGGAGFIGSHLTRVLLEDPQYNVVVLDKFTYAAHADNLPAEHPRLRVVRGDISDTKLVQELFHVHQFKQVLHFAAESHVDNSFIDSLPFCITNIIGTNVLLACAKDTPGFQRFIHVSTDEVYGECLDGNFDETAPLRPNNPYSASKAGAELLVTSYINSFNFPAIITRANNVYGPHQFPEKLIPKLLLQGLRGKSLTVHGSGSSIRNYLYATDAAQAFIAILQRGALGQTYNISGKQECSTLNIAQNIQALLPKNGAPAPHIQHVRDRFHNDKRYSVDATKLHNLGWTPHVTLEEGLQACLDWYRNMNKVRYTDISLEAHPAPRMQ